jgi:alpha-L-fucosidase
VTTGLVLDSGGNVASGSNLKQWNYDGSTNLQWQLVDLGNGYYRIVNRGTGTALDGAGSTAVGSTTVLWTPNSSTNNQWTITGV